jgi:hypothetical protein
MFLQLCDRNSRAAGWLMGAGLVGLVVGGAMELWSVEVMMRSTFDVP